VCSIGSCLFGRSVGIAAGVLAAACPFAFKTQVPLMTDGLAALLTLAGVRLLVGAVDRPTIQPFAWAGLIFGLGYLARPPVLLLFLAATVAMVLASTDRRSLTRPLVALFGGLALIVVPMSLFSLVTRGTPIYLGKSYLYAVTADEAVIQRSELQAVPTPAEFITTNAGYIVQSILTLAMTYARWLFLDPEWLLPLLPGWPLALLAFWRRQYPRVVWIPLSVAAVNYVFYSLTWASWQDRFMLPTLFLLLPFGVDGLFRALRLLFGRLSGTAGPSLSRWRLDMLVGWLAIAAITIFWFPQFQAQYRGYFVYFDRPTGTRVDAGIRWTGPPRWVNDGDFQEIVEWATTRTEPDAVLASPQPWPLALFSRRPVVLIPQNLSDAELHRFIVQYHVTYVLADGRDRSRRSYREYLDGLDDQGVQRTKLGAVTAFDTRPLWR
jgi:hypothetical protein